MDIKCLQLKKAKLIILLLTLAFSVNSQENMNSFDENGLEQFHSICGKFYSFNSESKLLKITCNDSMVSFLVSEFIMIPEEYYSLLDNISEWEMNKASSYIEIIYYGSIFYDNYSHSVKKELVCASYTKCNEIDTKTEVYNFIYDKNIKTLTGKLVSVEVGDYLHITIRTINGELHSFWMHYDVGEEMEELLYSKVDKPLNDSIQIKYCRTVGYIIEIGKPKLMNTCVDIIFK
jgi:hypothetical protein